MNAALAFQVVALSVAGISAAVRLPLAIKGRNPLIFWALVLLTTAIALGISSVYLAVDSVLGGMNLANLVIRFALYGFVLIIGIKSAAAFRAAGAAALIRGPIGICVLASVAVLTVVFFCLADMPVSSPGLRDYGEQLPVGLYGILARAYPAYIAACLIAPAFASAAHRRRPLLIRLGSGLLGIGLVGSVLYAIQDLTPLDVDPWDHFVPYSALTAVTVGLVLLGAQRTTSKRKTKNAPLTHTFAR
ncbi:hypothetical protein GD627_00440 [Arthrobacter yangruifuii]|uniref:Integral membrane protein n=1 Tax=Arthrobacter yangruifuii TaxID=2606616 RepID=A0A5N6MRW5_9MICC|nr:hypothetical protein [Arthrobacter yangruifuii]KAD4059616.1 hypothetical protein GD627_00440 [Arthrobacter yangruifuii]